MRRLALGLFAATLVASTPASAGVIFGSTGLAGGYRWDADPSRTFGGLERSLAGGLRYSVQGGSYQAFRDLFSWSGGLAPSVADFTTAVQQAFGAWTAVDPVSGFATSVSFVADFATTVVGQAGFGGVDVAGAEIDLFGEDSGSALQHGVSYFASTVNDNVTLTSGTTNYGGTAGGGAIIGADITLNTNTSAQYTLDEFRRLLTHEIGHAIGLGDAEDFTGEGFIDDNYDGTNSSTAANTLTNSWASLVNPLDPAASVGLLKFAPGVVANGDPGVDSAGVNILMESEGLGVAAGNPYSNIVPLTNDDFGTRQFLYPQLAAEATPEPSSLAFAVAGIASLIVHRRRSRS